MKALLLLLITSPLFAQIGPPVHKPAVDKAEWALLAADASSRALDVYSTHRALSNGHPEMFLPNAIASHTPAMAAYSAGTVALDWYVAHRLGPHHRRLAHILTMIDIAQDAPWAINNLFLSKPAPATVAIWH